MNNESKTLWIPLWGKAFTSREGLLPDPWAEEIVDTCGADFSRVDKSRRLAVMMALRAAEFDDMARAFAAEHPGGLILQLGVGLDSRVKRVNSGLLWYDLDFPEVIAVRRRYFPEEANYRLIPAPALPADWIESLPEAEDVLVIAEGLTMYLSEGEMRALLAAFRRKWRHTRFVFDAYTALGKRMSRVKNPVNAVGAHLDFTLDEGKALESEGVTCVLDEGLITQKGISRLRSRDRLRFRFMRRPGNRLYRLWGYDVNKM